MEIIMREYVKSDIPQMVEIWNQIVEEGNAYPQMTPLTQEKAVKFFGRQSHTGVAVQGNKVLGLYVAHPNNIGRCGHIANASYAVEKGSRNHKIGEALVLDSLRRCREKGFLILQFNAVVASNTSAIHLYEKIGFQKAGTIPMGFLNGKQEYEDICLYYYNLHKLI